MNETITDRNNFKLNPNPDAAVVREAVVTLTREEG